jgi:hypothetical protein
MLLGLSLIAAATFLLLESVHEAREVPMLSIGSFTVIAGHILNYRQLTSRCTVCEPADET